MPVPPPETAADLPETCRELTFEGVSYIVCEVDLDDYDVVLKRADAVGKPFRDLAKLAAAQPFVFAMNAGMYHEDFTPVGLHIENGEEQAPLNLADAPGNFFMKPNGVFYVDRDGNAGVASRRTERPGISATASARMGTSGRRSPSRAGRSAWAASPACSATSSSAKTRCSSTARFRRFTTGKSISSAENIRPGR
jgi:hypothetical protein